MMQLQKKMRTAAAAVPDTGDAGDIDIDDDAAQPTVDASESDSLSVWPTSASSAVADALAYSLSACAAQVHEQLAVRVTNSQRTLDVLTALAHVR